MVNNSSESLPIAKRRSKFFASLDIFRSRDPEPTSILQMNTAVWPWDVSLRVQLLLIISAVTFVYVFCVSPLVELSACSIKSDYCIQIKL